jgi:hypothetical protein
MSNKNHQDQSLSFEAQAAQAIKDEAMKIAKAGQTPGQTKKETQLIAKGIAKGIESYRKQEKIKARERSKNEKKKKAEPVTSGTDVIEKPKAASGRLSNILKYVANFLGLLSLAHFAVIFIPKQMLETNTHWLPIVSITLGIVYLMATFMLLKIVKNLRK